MKVVNGAYASAKIFTDTIEDYALVFCLAQALGTVIGIILHPMEPDGS